MILSNITANTTRKRKFLEMNQKNIFLETIYLLKNALENLYINDTEFLIVNNNILHCKFLYVPDSSLDNMTLPNELCHHIHFVFSSKESEIRVRSSHQPLFQILLTKVGFMNNNCVSNRKIINACIQYVRKTQCYIKMVRVTKMIQGYCRKDSNNIEIYSHEHPLRIMVKANHDIILHTKVDDDAFLSQITKMYPSFQKENLKIGSLLENFDNLMDRLHSMISTLQPIKSSE